MIVNGRSVLCTLLIAVICAAVFFGCQDTGNGQDERSVQSTLPSLPVYSRHPTSANYLLGDTPKTLNAEVSVADNGTLSYRWYEANSFTNNEGEIIEGETTASYIPDISEPGTRYYYFETANTNHGKTRTAKSHPARIAVVEKLPDIPEYEINITSNQVQYIRGFGGMSHAWSSPKLELSDIDTMYHPETGLGLNMFRIMLYPYPLEEILQDKYYVTEYNKDSGKYSGEVKELNRHYVELVKRVNSYGGYVLASPWSPPPEFKTNDSTLGGYRYPDITKGRLRPEKYNDYAYYLKNFVQEMADRGAPIYTVSVQHGPDYVSEIDGMAWSQEEYLKWMKESAPLFHNPPVRGYGGGREQERVLLTGAETDNDIKLNETALNDPEARANTDIVAYHPYRRQFYPQARLGTDKKEIWMTEISYTDGTGSIGSNLNDVKWFHAWRVPSSINSTIANANASVYIWWYAKRFYSFIGDGFMTSVNGSVMPRGWAVSHYAKYATDTVRLETNENLPGIINSHDLLKQGFGITAYIRKSNPDMSDFDEQRLQSREDSISLVIYDFREYSQASQRNISIRINLPEGFIATNVFGIVSDGNVYHEPLLIVLGEDGTYADITLPYDSIVSVKFVK